MLSPPTGDFHIAGLQLLYFIVDLLPITVTERKASCDIGKPCQCAPYRSMKTVVRLVDYTTETVNATAL